jgi:predicted oxidoreductase
MKKLLLGPDQFEVPEIALGCMRLASLDDNSAAGLIETALDAGINFFDHADIYGGGESESRFAHALQLARIPREKLILQTKCGICSDYFDFSKAHILHSVDDSLRRLHTDFLDILLLHRPDALMQPAEVAEAFETLEQTGKVKYFGVSNQNPGQIALLQKYVRQPLLINQLQMSVVECGMIDAGLNVNMKNDFSVNRDGGVLEYCRLHDIIIQPWSPLQHGMIAGSFIGNPLYPEVNERLGQIGRKYGITPAAAAIAWLLRHPAGMQPIVGTTNRQHLAEISKASGVSLTREEWYAVYLSAGKELP